MALFAQQAKEVDIIVTTALIRELLASLDGISSELIADKLLAGKPAPRLILKEHVEAMKRELMNDW